MAIVKKAKNKTTNNMYTMKKQKNNLLGGTVAKVVLVIMALSFVLGIIAEIIVLSTDK